MTILISFFFFQFQEKKKFGFYKHFFVFFISIPFHSHIPTPIPRIPTLIPRIPTPILRIPTPSPCIYWKQVS